MKLLLYNSLLSAAALVAGPWYAWRFLVSGKYRTSLGPKLGFHPAETFDGIAGSPRIWIHAVSVGEVTAAAPIIACLRRRHPAAALLLSTGTETGQEAAGRLVPDATARFYFPLDIPRVIRGVIDHVAPDVFVAVETELWPNFLRICRERSIRVVMVNGRLSPRSYRRYRATKWFWKSVLDGLDGAGVISAGDGERLRSLGMDPSRVSVLGNAKYDGLVERAAPALSDAEARLLACVGEGPVIVAGSTHEGEETLLIDVYRGLSPANPGLRLILAPRHVERASAILSLVRERGCAAAALTDIETGAADPRTPVVVVDLMGRLFSLYGMADVVFCGGSLVRRGGQNVLEPAAWGKAVLHGPYMDDFHEEGRLIDEAGCGITVKNAAELAGCTGRLLADPGERRQRGEAGRRVVEGNRGAADRYADLVSRHLDHRHA